MPVAGDWTGTGTSKIGIFRSGYFWMLDANGNGVIGGDDSFFAFGGAPGDIPLVGDWTRDGVSKVGLFRNGFLWILGL